MATGVLLSAPDALEVVALELGQAFAVSRSGPSRHSRADTRELHEPHWAQYQRMSDLSSSTSRSSSPDKAASTMQRGSYCSKCSAAGQTDVHMPHARHDVRARRATELIVEPPGAGLFGCLSRRRPPTRSCRPWKQGPLPLARSFRSSGLPAKCLRFG